MRQSITVVFTAVALCLLVAAGPARMFSASPALAAPPLDAGTVDAGPPLDATPPFDAGIPDASSDAAFDAALPDAGRPDATPIEAARVLGEVQGS